MVVCFFKKIDGGKIGKRLLDFFFNYWLLDFFNNRRRLLIGDFNQFLFLFLLFLIWLNCNHLFLIFIFLYIDWKNFVYGNLRSILQFNFICFYTLKLYDTFPLLLNTFKIRIVDIIVLVLPGKKTTNWLVIVKDLSVTFLIVICLEFAYILNFIMIGFTNGIYKLGFELHN